MREPLKDKVKAGEVTVFEAAQRLNMSDSTLRRHIRFGHIAADYRDGNYFLKEVVVELVRIARENPSVKPWWERIELFDCKSTIDVTGVTQEVLKVSKKERLEAIAQELNEMGYSVIAGTVALASTHLK